MLQRSFMANQELFYSTKFMGDEMDAPKYGVNAPNWF
jgi:hypothetical protein